MHVGVGAKVEKTSNTSYKLKLRVQFQVVHMFSQFMLYTCMFVNPPLIDEVLFTAKSFVDIIRKDAVLLSNKLREHVHNSTCVQLK